MLKRKTENRKRTIKKDDLCPNIIACDPDDLSPAKSFEITVDHVLKSKILFEEINSNYSNRLSLLFYFGMICM